MGGESFYRASDDYKSDRCARGLISAQESHSELNS